MKFAPHLPLLSDALLAQFIFRDAITLNYIWRTVKSMKFSACIFLHYPVTSSTHFFLFLSILLHGDCINIFYIFIFTSYEIPEITVLGKRVCASYVFSDSLCCSFYFNP